MSPHTTFRSMFLISGASANLSARRRWRIRQRARSVNDRRYVQCEQLWKQAPETERTPRRRQFAKAFQMDFSFLTISFAKKPDLGLRNFLARFSATAAIWSHRTRF